MMCGSAFKNKGVQAMLDAGYGNIYHHHIDIDAITGVQILDTDEEISRKP